MRDRIFAVATLLGCFAAFAGEIVIVQPAEKDSRSVREQTRSERELDRTMDKARRYGGGAASTPVFIDETGDSRLRDHTDQSIRDAQDYLRPGSGEDGMSGTGGTTIILRAAPPSETEKLRQKARSYLAPESAARGGKNCEVANTVGTIGEGVGTEHSSNVIEKGNSAVIVNCK